MLGKINLFLILSVFMLIGAGYYTWSQYNFITHSLRGPGTVVNVTYSRSSSSRSSGSYHPVVDFRTQDGTMVTFTSNVGSNPASYKKNERVDVLYNQDDPKSAQIDRPFDLWMGQGIVWILGIGFMIAGISIGFAAPISQKAKEELMRSGRKIDTTIVSHKIAFYLNRRPIWVIKSTYTDGSKTYTFKSRGLNFDVSGIINREGLKTIPVWVDHANMKKYYMAAEELKNLGTQPEKPITETPPPTLPAQTSGKF